MSFWGPDNCTVQSFLVKSRRKGNNLFKLHTSSVACPKWIPLPTQEMTPSLTDYFQMTARMKSFYCKSDNVTLFLKLFDGCSLYLNTKTVPPWLASPCMTWSVPTPYLSQSNWYPEAPCSLHSRPSWFLMHVPHLLLMWTLSTIIPTACSFFLSYFLKFSEQL